MINPITIFPAVLSALNTDKLILEAELERVINIDMPSPDKILKIKELLKDISNAQNMIILFKQYITPETNSIKE